MCVFVKVTSIRVYVEDVDVDLGIIPGGKGCDVGLKCKSTSYSISLISEQVRCYAPLPIFFLVCLPPFLSLLPSSFDPHETLLFDRA